MTFASSEPVGMESASGIDASHNNHCLPVASAHSIASIGRNERVRTGNRAFYSDAAAAAQSEFRRGLLTNAYASAGQSMPTAEHFAS